jgi:ABC-type multidrug transport system permease subunit
MNPFDTLGTVIVGVYRTGKMQAWAKLAASCIATAFVSFWGTLGITLMSGKPMAYAIGAASLSMALSFLALWVRSPLTKGIPILYPGKIAAARIEQLTADGTEFNPNEGKR